MSDTKPRTRNIRDYYKMLYLGISSLNYRKPNTKEKNPGESFPIKGINRSLTSREAKIQITYDFSSETLQARR